MMTSKIEDRLRKNGVKIKKVLQVAQMVYDINFKSKINNI